MKLYSIYDMKAECYGPIITAVSDGIASRVFTECVMRGNPDYRNYPEDFTLFCIGEFDDCNGVVSSSCSRPVITAVSIVQMIRGAAVGGESPLKSQSVNNAESDMDAASSAPACDVEDSALSKLKETENA